MKITKEELYKLIDSLDENSYCLWRNLIELIKECQKPKELTLHEKLINAGFVMRNKTCNYHYYINTTTQIKVTPYEEFISVETLTDRINVFDIDNHSKILEVIEFLTNFQGKYDNCGNLNF